MKTPAPRGRLPALAVLCIAVFALFLGRLAWMQFFCADEYAAKLTQASTASYLYTTPAARGSLISSDGVVLACDRAAYQLYLRLPAPPGSELSKTLATALEVLSPAQKADSKDVETSLAACLTFLRQNPAGELLLAESLSPAQAARLRQTGLCDAGALRLCAVGQRQWTSPALFPHVLGVTGPVTAAQWEQDGAALAGAGYAKDSVLGQSGLEAALEPLLHGADGRTRVSVDRRNGEVSETQTVAPAPGKTVVLTLDAGLQQAASQALSSQLETLRATKPAGKGKEACAGAVVVVDAGTGGILASISLPGYDLSSYRSSYATLAADEAQPLFDRASFGLYAPGSAFKPAVAAAALAGGVVAPSDTVFCSGAYRYYAGYQPRCLQLGHSGPVDLTAALANSCNLYFYDVGRRTGVDAVADSAALLGLAVPTGSELPGALGRLTRSADENYQDGLALQAAIGQGNAAVTPMQLASYACALANNGQRLRLHFVTEVQDSRTGGTLSSYGREVLSTLPGGETVFGPIRQGMTSMAQTLSALREAPVSVAAKTGSPQRAERFGSGYYTNSVLIGYAPAKSPRIAVAVVLEYGGGGANAAPILRTLLEYFFTDHGN